jgi:hypothetical protein
MAYHIIIILATFQFYAKGQNLLNYSKENLPQIPLSKEDHLNKGFGNNGI